MKSNKIYTLFVIFLLSFTVVSAQQKVKITILHTNDTHSQVDPTEMNNSKSPDLGGYVRRIGLIEKVRQEEKNVLLLDAGDYWQGTPYFNFYNGRVEIEALNRMRYDAVTLGNHEFDNGVDTLAALFHKLNVPVLSSNYRFENEYLKERIKPYKILKIDGVRIGIMALNVNPEGLIAQENYIGVEYLDPIKIANEMSDFLRNKKKCDLVICLSHLGADIKKSDVTDFAVARATKNIDIIIGGHSHQIIENTTEKNLTGKEIIIAQMGKSGLYLGRIDLELEKK